MVRLCSYNWYKNHDCTDAQNFAIENNTELGLKILADLCPSQELNEFYQANPNSFEYFAEGYSKELLSTDTQKILTYIEFCSKAGININLVCSCLDYHKCHRDLIMQTLLNRGVECQCV